MSPYLGPGFPGPTENGGPPEAGARYMSLETSDLDNPQAGVTTYWPLGFSYAVYFGEFLPKMQLSWESRSNHDKI